MQRHIGRNKNTDQRVVVVFLQIPGREDHALTVTTDTLPARFEQALMQIVQSPEGQAAEDLGTVLTRRMIPDMNVSFLNALHNSQMLVPQPIDNIIMYPAPNQPYPLRDILIGMGRKITTTPPQAPEPSLNPYLAEASQYPLADETVTEQPTLFEDPQHGFGGNTVEKFNPHMHNKDATKNDQNIGIARNLLIEAELLMEEVNRKREQAYRYAPSLRPDSNGTKIEVAANSQLIPINEVAPKETKTVAPKAAAKPKPARKTPTRANTSKAAK